MNDVSQTPETIFGEAIEISSRQDRALFLDGACQGNAALRREVEKLVEDHFLAGSFLESPSPGLAATTDSPPIAERPGAIIGPYKLLQQIGEGGMGVVFMAEQTEPLQRTVALKIIKPGMDTRQVIARFEAERQALAMMDHPNIAKVLDAGTTGAGSMEQGAGSPEEFLLHAPRSPLPAISGRPYFVMELVKGVPITEYCDEQHLSVRQRLELMTQVCQAVQHAHQKGIIHRDLKPSNVLVAEYDGEPVPKIIDFGVAKATEKRLTERTMFTVYGQLIGTFEYMSPEQARFNQLDVDTRSDIYSLGVLLYELLTGSTPFEQKRLREAAFDEVLRIIREEEPPKPSTRLSHIARPSRPGSATCPSVPSPSPDPAETAGLSDTATIAANRGMEPGKLVSLLRGELDWIVMKCLEKDRSRRYETPNSLARDIERYLNDEPVQACPPSTSYRFRKFARRNKTLLAAGGAIAAALVVGLGLSTWQYFRATTESARAKAVSKFLQEMLASSDPDRVKGAAYTVRQLLDDFSAGLGDQLANEPEVEADIHGTIGRAYHSLGVYDRAEVHHKKALDMRRELFGAGDERIVDSLVDYAWSLDGLGRYEEAEKHAREALSICRQHNSDPHLTILTLRTLLQHLIRQSRLAEAEEVANEALALTGDEKDCDVRILGGVLNSLADVKLTQGKYEEAENFARRSMEIHRRRHADQHPQYAHGLWSLGSALKGQQKLAEAETAMREALAIFRKNYPPEHDTIQNVSQQLKLVLEAKGDRAGAEALIGKESNADN